jgi:hypothetical protein
MKSPFQLKSLIAVAGAAMFALLAAPIASHQLSGGMYDLVAGAQAADSGHDHASGSSGKKGKGKSSSQKGGMGGSQDGGSSHDTGEGGASKSLESKVFSADTGHGSDTSNKGKGPKYMGGGKGGEDHTSGHDSGSDTEHVK